MTFQDGANVDVCGEHLWTITKSGNGEEGRKTVNTLELIKMLDYENNKPKGKRRRWPLVDLVSNLDYSQEKEHLLHPYLVGCLLGDGSINKEVAISSADVELIERLRNLGYTLNKRSSKYAYGIHGIKDKLIQLGMLGHKSYTKSIPKDYLDSTQTDRLELLRGLMDTDGCANLDSSIEFCTVSKQLANDVQYLVRSLGGTATITEKKTNSNFGKAYILYIRHPDASEIFTLTRKKERCKSKKLKNRIKNIKHIGTGLSTCISISGQDKQFVTKDFIVTHNSHLMLMHPLQHINDPDFNAIFFRRVTTQLVGSGGLWPESLKMYSPFRTHTRTKPQYQHVFPSGSTLTFGHMQHEDSCTDHQGLQYSAVFFDELTHFTERQFTYLLSRLRSEADSDSYCFASCNPDADSWVLSWIEWWLDKDGFPDKEKQGKVRYYIVVDDKPIFRDTPQELKDDYPDFCKIWNPVDEVYVEIEPKSITFVSGTIFDNPILIKKNPKYLAELNALPRVEKDRLLHGNWYSRPEGSAYWSRSWVKNVDFLPPNVTRCRAYDKGASIQSEVNRYPDPTASIGLAKDKDGFFYIFADYIEGSSDEKSDILGRFCRLAGERDKIIEDQAIHDGSDCIVVLPKDVGQAGIVEFQESAKKLASIGITAVADPMPNNKSKLTKFSPFAAACQNGLVRIVESSFPNKATLDWFYGELEAFNGERSTATRKDEAPDACASAYNYMCRQKVLPSFTLPSGLEKDNQFKIKMN